ncbi:hypothetical protein [uncultured Enterococcus sp.]|uniref:hypothetical protein n=1 Tax=uncultured Enterococcus sp. TaxID=167972 RepID=UPI0025E964DE|nr:hypothetical protein [uncultured Enterococcus sp.]
MTNEAAKEIFGQMEQLVAENPQSVLNFDQELQQAEVLTEKQQAEIKQMTLVHTKIKEVAASKTHVTTQQLQELKTQFTTHYTQYQTNEAELKVLYTTLKSAYDIENKIMKDYLLAESTQMLEALIGKLTDQDEHLEQVKQVISEVSKAEQEVQTEVAESLPDSTIDQEVVEEVSLTVDLSESDSSTETIDVAVTSETVDIHDQILSAQEMFLSESTHSTL